MKKIKAFLAAVMMLTALPVGISQNTDSVSAKDTDTLNGTYVIRNVNSKIYMSIEKDNNIIQNTLIRAETSNTWQLKESGDYYQFLSPDGSAIQADAKSGNVSIAKASGKDEQLFSLDANADGSFRIVSKSTGKAVEIINADTAPGANVQLWELNGINCQDWELIPVSVLSENPTETKVTVTGGSDYIAGDLNNDKIVNIYDWLISKQILLSGKGTTEQKRNANVTGDGNFAVKDIIALQKYLHGKQKLVKQDTGAERRYAAINGNYTEGVSETTNTGFTESAYLNLDNKENTSVNWTVSADSDGIYAVTVRYANGGTADRSIAVTVSNQIQSWTLQGKTTGAWTDWQEETVYLPLQSGMNQITFTSQTSDGAPNIDYIAIKKSDQKASPSQEIAPIQGKPVDLNENNQYGIGRQVEDLNRGIVAANTGSGMLISWRLLATDSSDTHFKLYRNGEFVADIASGQASNYYIDGGKPEDAYTIDTFVGTTMTEFANTATVFGTKNSGQSGAYFDIPTQKPADLTMPDGTTCTYTENDCSVADVDGDGEYEIIVKWDPSNSQDNSKNGYTGNVYLDCYKLNGKMLWRIDLGKNIRAGAHYTQFNVYDFDGDGKAELICKTADGTVDGKGKTIGDAKADYRNSAGRILTGPEYITLFDGETGAALDTQNYDPARGDFTDWGDDYGNRVDRFTACVAYLDGEHPSAVFGRGYYTRAVVAAWDVKDHKLVKRWTWDSGYDKNTAGYGDGNHHCMAADVDNDGYDEVVIGSAVVDHNGKLLYTTGNAHGDSIHIGDFDLSNPGLEIFQCLEDEVHPNGKKINFGVQLRDAATGKELFRETAGDDTGRCLADNLIPGNDSAEMVGSHSGNVYATTGNHEIVCQWSDITKWGQNSVVYWTDVLERAVLDRTMVDQYGKGRVFTGDGISYNNASKSNACITCDLMGDWREEMIFRKSDGTGLRVFTTTYTSEYPIYTLMHNTQYRVQVASQNNGYNQPPHTDYFLGTDYDLPELPTVYTPSSKKN
ncbi:MAG: RICIN domain-containing protein [Oscillospiraceae bacterium]|nr:RICIN domain-containing protein [Oscillospiraceae bacterium]